ncbi:MAG: DNA primase [Ignavibacteria bacterium]|nr:DNA primase [Ignavibacteria bacterium]
MGYSKETIAELRLKTDILDVIGEYLRLKRVGKRYVAFCPFHDDKKTPSFSISPELGLYHCFGCKRSGDAFKFISDYLGVTYTEAVEFLAKKYNVNLKAESGKKSSDEIEILFNVLQSAANIYHSNLFKKDCSVALDYFYKRNFTQNTIKEFLLGYSINYEQIIFELKKLGFDEKVIVDAGIAGRRSDGSLYDRFAGRVIFTIRDFLGRVVGFGGRDISGRDDIAKYVNSPQTKIYDKSKILYGIFEARNEIRNLDKAIIVEGYVDVISLHQAGVKNVVASSGTALTSQQLDLLGRYSKNLFLVFDADEAGQKATYRAIELGLSKGFDLKVVSLPDGEDPDSLINHHGKSLFEARLRDSKTFLKYAVELFLSKGEPTALAKANFAREMLSLISKIQDTFQHDFLITELARLLDLTENQVRLLYSERNKNVKSSLQNIETDTPEKPQNSVDQGNSIHFNIDEILPEEKMIIKLAMKLPKYFKIIDEMGITEATFISASAKTVYSIIHEYSNELYILQSIIENENYPSNVKNSLISLMMEEAPSERWKEIDETVENIDVRKIISDALIKLELRIINNEIDEIKARIANAESEILDRLLKRQAELTLKRNALSQKIMS